MNFFPNLPIRKVDPTKIRRTDRIVPVALALLFLSYVWRVDTPSGSYWIGWVFAVVLLLGELPHVPRAFV
ncbi:MAG TPA: hypothetical protein PK765_01200 [bacterium]|nr:hypothetical protein [bacterium]